MRRGALTHAHGRPPAARHARALAPAHPHPKHPLPWPWPPRRTRPPRLSFRPRLGSTRRRRRRHRRHRTRQSRTTRSHGLLADGPAPPAPAVTAAGRAWLQLATSRGSLRNIERAKGRDQGRRIGGTNQTPEPHFLHPPRRRAASRRACPSRAATRHRHGSRRGRRADVPCGAGAWEARVLRRGAPVPTRGLHRRGSGRGRAGRHGRQPGVAHPVRPAGCVRMRVRRRWAAWAGTAGV